MPAVRTKLLIALAAALLCSTPTALAKQSIDTNADKSTAAAQSLPVITGPELKAKLDKHEKVTLVEALEPKYFKLCHLPGAIRITDVDSHITKKLPDKSAEIVVYCMNTH